MAVTQLKDKSWTVVLDSESANCDSLVIKGEVGNEFCEVLVAAEEEGKPFTFTLRVRDFEKAGRLSFSAAGLERMRDV